MAAAYRFLAEGICTLGKVYTTYDEHDPEEEPDWRPWKYRWFATEIDAARY